MTPLFCPFLFCPCSPILSCDFLVCLRNHAVRCPHRARGTAPAGPHPLRISGRLRRAGRRPMRKSHRFNWVDTGKGYPFLPESPSNAGAPCTCAGWKIVPLRGDFPFLDIHGIAYHHFDKQSTLFPHKIFRFFLFNIDETRSIVRQRPSLRTIPAFSRRLWPAARASVAKAEPPAQKKKP